MLAAGDLNGDGLLDLVQGVDFGGNGEAGVVRGGPTGFRASLPFTSAGVSSIAIGDLTGRQRRASRELGATAIGSER